MLQALTFNQLCDGSQNQLNLMYNWTIFINSVLSSTHLKLLKMTSHIFNALTQLLLQNTVTMVLQRAYCVHLSTDLSVYVSSRQPVHSVLSSCADFCLKWSGV